METSIEITMLSETQGNENHVQTRYVERNAGLADWPHSRRT